jgi:hypothetical protein
MGKRIGDLAALKFLGSFASAQAPAGTMPHGALSARATAASEASAQVIGSTR